MKSHLTALLFLVLTLSACDNNSTDTSSTGTLNGQARLFDEKGTEIQDKSGVTVSLKERPISTTTTSSGSWQLSNVPIGTYTILFSKPGFDTSKIFGFQFNGYGDVRVNEMPELLKPAPGRIEQLLLSTRNTDSADMFVIKASASQDAKLVESRLNYILKISTNPNSSFENSDNSVMYEMIYHETYNENAMYLSELKKYFNSGTTVYANARIVHPRYGVRFDNFGNRYYVGLGQPSETVSLVIP